MDHDDTVRMLEEIATAFDTHDLDGIMSHFADDAVFDGPRGGEMWGARFVGREAVRRAFAARFAGIPDVRCQDDSHFADGIGARRSGRCPAPRLTASGSRSGCDLWTLRDGQIVKKDLFWKIRTRG